MTELRLPDPTLSALDRVHVFVTDAGEPRMAHLDGESACPVKPGLLGHLEPTSDARWFAVPCRECFPDALLPGHKPGCCGKPDCRGSRTPRRDPHLAWQVPS